MEELIKKFNELASKLTEKIASESANYSSAQNSITGNFENFSKGFKEASGGYTTEELLTDSTFKNNPAKKFVIAYNKLQDEPNNYESNAKTLAIISGEGLEKFKTDLKFFVENYNDPNFQVRTSQIREQLENLQEIYETAGKAEESTLFQLNQFLKKADEKTLTKSDSSPLIMQLDKSNNDLKSYIANNQALAKPFGEILANVKTLQTTSNLNNFLEETNSYINQAKLNTIDQAKLQLAYNFLSSRTSTMLAEPVTIGLEKGRELISTKARPNADIIKPKEVEITEVRAEPENPRKTFLSQKVDPLKPEVSDNAYIYSQNKLLENLEKLKAESEIIKSKIIVPEIDTQKIGTNLSALAEASRKKQEAEKAILNQINLIQAIAEFTEAVQNNAADEDLLKSYQKLKGLLGRTDIYKDQNLVDCQKDFEGLENLQLRLKNEFNLESAIIIERELPNRTKEARKSKDEAVDKLNYTNLPDADTIIYTKQLNDAQASLDAEYKKLTDATIRQRQPFIREAINELPNYYKYFDEIITSEEPKDVINNLSALNPRKSNTQTLADNEYQLVTELHQELKDKNFSNDDLKDFENIVSKLRSQGDYFGDKIEASEITNLGNDAQIKSSSAIQTALEALAQKKRLEEANPVKTKN